MKKWKCRNPNIVFIVADDMGYGDLSCLKEPGYTTGCVGRWHLGCAWPARSGTTPAGKITVRRVLRKDVELAKKFLTGVMEVDNSVKKWSSAASGCGSLTAHNCAKGRYSVGMGALEGDKIPPINSPRSEALQERLCTMRSVE